MLHHLLWTSGWDSTFRLLDLLIVKKEEVQPYYLLDPSRHSTYKELQAMNNIRHAVFVQYPHTKELLLRTKFFEVSSLQPNSKIREIYHQIKEKTHIGTQYEWLALFVEENQIPLEIGVEKPPSHLLNRQPYWVDFYIVNHIESTQNEGNTVNKLASTSEAYQLFKHFEFPLIEMTKLDCKAYAIEHRFIQIMELTWFCHAPVRELPCGKCAPCVQAMKYGFAYRIPVRGKAFYYLHQLKKSIKKLF